MFLTMFLIGAIGFVAMAFLSAGSMLGHVGGLHVSAHGHGGPGHVHGPAGGHALGGHGSHALPQGQGQSHHGVAAKTGITKSTGQAGGSALTQFLIAALSPLQIFIFLLGFGATGLLVQPYLQNGVIWIAIAGALVLNFLIIRPLMGVLLRFASRPSDCLEGMVADEAEAVSSFDQQGRGLVKLTLDGQLVQLLATLDKVEHGKGVTVAKGDRLVILEVDSEKNQCRVSRELVVA